ncbi:uncharacterized protein LOC121867092 [Homarus americanus]|uniref:uncharacterized protein LOC121867092 n=1 Tax=Homarus americanus TaxID=6706 RepID=UPI001C44AB3D|nr:uncharacterized protein LOC121867092 [Homarus americanus]
MASHYYIIDRKRSPRRPHLEPQRARQRKLLLQVDKTVKATSLHKKFNTKNTEVESKRRDLYMAFIDLTKAFSSVNRSPWLTLSSFGCPPEDSSPSGEQLHDGVNGSDLYNGTQSGSFPAIRRKVSAASISDLQFVDDLIHVTHTERDLKEIMNTYTDEYGHFSLKVNLDKMATETHNMLVTFMQMKL